MDLKNQTIFFINTRPADVARSLTDGLMQLMDLQRNHDTGTRASTKVLELPLLQIEPLKPTLQDEHKLNNLQNYHLGVCVSPRAAKLASPYFKKIPKQLKKSLNWIAVGSSTAAVLRCFDIIAATPAVASNEGLVAMAQVSVLQPTDKVLILRGVGGRRLLSDALIERGITVDAIELYRRQKPSVLPAHVEQMKAVLNNAVRAGGVITIKVVVLISSGEAWQNWLNVCDTPSDYSYLCLGRRLHSKVIGYGCDSLQIADLQAQTVARSLKLFA